MKKQLITVAVASGIAFAGAAGVASAQGYGDTPSSPAPASQDGGASTGPVLPVQDADGQAPDEAQEDDRRRGGRGHRGDCHTAEIAADAIGIDVDELRAALDEGQSIADVATANDVDPATVVQAMVDARMERLAEKVEAGELTQEEADQRMEEATERIEEQVDRVPGEGRPDAGRPEDAPSPGSSNDDDGEA